MKRKDKCGRCGKTICANKLHKSKTENVMICGYCYYSENVKRNKSFFGRIKGTTKDFFDKSLDMSIKDKNVGRMAKNE